MRIVAPANFRHAAEIPARFANNDPRAESFGEDSVEIDLRACEFVRPPAVLWCVVYPLLARGRGAECRLLVPEHMGVSAYLKSLGVFQLLKEDGVEVDDRGVRATSDSHLVLPLTSFWTQAEVDDLANKALDSLSSGRLGATSLYPLVSEVFAELALNAVEHSESPIGAFGFIQFYEFRGGSRFVCGVADGGIGIRRSLERNPELAGKFFYDWDAIERALEERVSGTGLKTRGIGLFGVAEDMRQPNRMLIIHSGLGSVEISEDAQRRAKRTKLFPGTLAYASIPS